VGVSWHVTTDKYSYTSDTAFLAKGSRLLSAYTTAMKALHNEYGSYRDIDETTAYMFFFNQYGTGTKEGRDTYGFMPRDKQFAYMFTEGLSDDELYVTAAHELGHGRFILRHVFDGEYNISPSSTNNLMDYLNGSHIAKWQWDLMHDPGVVVRVFEKDEDAMRKKETERSQITRFIYALRDALQNDTPFAESNVLKTEDKDILNAKKEDYTVKADHIFYNELLSDYFEEVEIKLFFDAKNRRDNSPNELFFLRQINKITYQAWMIHDLDVVIAFVFTQKKDMDKFMELLGEKEMLTPPTSSTRKAFFVHGTSSDSERWMEHPLTKTVLLNIANTNQYDDKFSWEKYNSLTEQGIYAIGLLKRNQAAQELVDYVMKNSQGFNEIVLIGHSHGGNVSLQAVNQLVSKGKTVYLITISTPAYNSETVEVDLPDALQNCDFIREISRPHFPIMNSLTTYEFKNPENPANPNLTKHLHLWNKKDIVAGGLAGDDYYKSNGITENIEIPVEKEYSSISIFTEKMMNAHGFDANRPQLVYKMLSNGKISIIE
jgi:hypothetical protein